MSLFDVFYEKCHFFVSAGHFLLPINSCWFRYFRPNQVHRHYFWCPFWRDFSFWQFCRNLTDRQKVEKRVGGVGKTPFFVFLGFSKIIRKPSKRKLVHKMYTKCAHFDTFKFWLVQKRKSAVFKNWKSVFGSKILDDLVMADRRALNYRFVYTTLWKARKKRVFNSSTSKMVTHGLFDLARKSGQKCFFMFFGWFHQFGNWPFATSDLFFGCFLRFRDHILDIFGNGTSNFSLFWRRKNLFFLYVTRLAVFESGRNSFLVSFGVEISCPGWVSKTWNLENVFLVKMAKSVFLVFEKCTFVTFCEFSGKTYVDFGKSDQKQGFLRSFFVIFCHFLRFYKNTKNLKNSKKHDFVSFWMSVFLNVKNGRKVCEKGRFWSFKMPLLHFFGRYGRVPNKMTFFGTFCKKKNQVFGPFFVPAFCSFFSCFWSGHDAIRMKSAFFETVFVATLFRVFVFFGVTCFQKRAFLFWFPVFYSGFLTWIIVKRQKVVFLGVQIRVLWKMYFA